MGHILIIDDEPEIRTLIRIHMERAGFQVIEAESGRTAIERMQEYNIELLILDLMMDDGDGITVLRYLQEHNLQTIVIALSARREVQDKIATLSLGAVDYVTKPFSPLELLARVQAQLRRHRPNATHQSEIIRLHHLVLDVDNLVLHNNGKSRDLTPVECALLKFFMQNPDRALTKRAIYKHIWQHENYDDNNLSVFISRLRKILESSSGSQYSIYTVRGVGYRFSGDRR
ncbi:response regulator transcription factor [Paenibacillus sp. B2(2019)]|uniref:response regulator transcription factor n=1 Tax=Paenibacillus sp. B2(2019) TaxID=2607754 RepID=UPI0011F3AB72|nr:response regulator transcription factor [Paenibacillus sp. B2(2019)]KAA1183515.1 response regulator transcription factor [Paenibacillus sp. B2(2019)]